MTFTADQRAAQELLLKKLLDVARADPSITVAQLAERFGKCKDFVRTHLQEAGLSRKGSPDVTYREARACGGDRPRSFAGDWRRAR